MRIMKYILTTVLDGVVFYMNDPKYDTWTSHRVGAKEFDSFLEASNAYRHSEQKSVSFVPVEERDI